MSESNRKLNAKEDPPHLVMLTMFSEMRGFIGSVKAVTELILIHKEFERIETDDPEYRTLLESLIERGDKMLSNIDEYSAYRRQLENEYFKSDEDSTSE